MPKFRVIITGPGKKNLGKIDTNSRLKILQKLKILKSSPFPTIKSIKKIKESRKIPLFRLRSGDYRIIYHIRNTTVYIFAVIHRKNFDGAVKTVIKLFVERLRTGRHFG